MCRNKTNGPVGRYQSGYQPYTIDKLRPLQRYLHGGFLEDSLRVKPLLEVFSVLSSVYRQITNSYELCTSVLYFFHR